MNNAHNPALKKIAVPVRQPDGSQGTGDRWKLVVPRETAGGVSAGPSSGSVINPFEVQAPRDSRGFDVDGNYLDGSRSNSDGFDVDGEYRDPENFQRDMEAKEKEAKDSTDPEHLDKLAYFGFYGVKWEVADNEHTSTETLTRMIVTNDNLLAERALARRTDAEPSLLVKLSTHENEHVRRGVGGNPKTPAATLKALAKSNDFDVKSAVAGNASTSDATLRLLADRNGCNYSNVAISNLRNRGVW